MTNTKQKYGRGSGRTTEILGRVALAAQKTKHVFFVVHNVPMIDYARDLLVEKLLPESDVRTVTRETITLKSGHVIHISCCRDTDHVRERTNGYSLAAIYYDNAWG